MIICREALTIHLPSLNCRMSSSEDDMLSRVDINNTSNVAFEGAADDDVPSGNLDTYGMFFKYTLIMMNFDHTGVLYDGQP